MSVQSRGMVAVACILLAACSSSGGDDERESDAEAEKPYAIVGSLTRRFEPPDTAAALESASTGCVDLDRAEVRVFNVNGDVAGESQASAVQTEGSSCTVTFAVEVAREPAYTISVANASGPTYTFDELRELAFRVELEQTVALDELDILPNVLGLDASRAEAELAAYGVGTEVQELCLKDESLGVVGQDPPGGSFLPVDGVVLLTVNQVRQVPFVVNMPEDRAIDRLEALGFVVDVDYVNNDVFGPGRVDDQRDATWACPGDTVKLLVET